MLLGLGQHALFLELQLLNLTHEKGMIGSQKHILRRLYRELHRLLLLNPGYVFLLNRSVDYVTKLLSL